MKYRRTSGTWLLLVVPFVSASYNEIPGPDTSLGINQSEQKCTVCSSCTLPSSLTAEKTPAATPAAVAGQHAYDAETRLSYPESPWLVVTCAPQGGATTTISGSQQDNILDLRTCGRNKASSERFWATDDPSNPAKKSITCQDSFSSSGTTGAGLLDLHIQCTSTTTTSSSSSSSSPPLLLRGRNKIADAVFTANIHIDTNGKVRCAQVSAMDDGHVEPQEKEKAKEENASPVIVDELVVRVVSSDAKNATSIATVPIATDSSTNAENITDDKTTATTSSSPVTTGAGPKSNTTMSSPDETPAVTATTSSTADRAQTAPTSSCTAIVPDRAFKPAGYDNGSVCQDVVEDTKHGGAVARVCGTVFKELLFGLGVYIIMVIVGLI